MELFTGLWNSFYEAFIYKNRYEHITNGLKYTLLITICAALIGIVIGTIIALIKVNSSNVKILKPFDMIASVYLAVIRGTPVVVQLMVMYYVILGSGINKVTAAILTFGINSGAYVAELIRTGILSVDKGQTEAGRSLGLTNRTTMFKIVFPQALKNILPALGNECIALLKETSVAGFIGVTDLSKGSDVIRSQTYDAFTPLITVAIIYFIIVFGLTTVLGKFERRLRKSDIR